MSMTGVSDPDRVLKKSFHRRNDSGELDVFEAARYFSGYNEAASYNCATFSQKIMMREELRHQQQQPWRSVVGGGGGGGRISLDMPIMRNPLPQQQHQHQHIGEKQIKEKKYKQPSSPGGRLASFLNSLFNQTGSKKKKKSKSTTQSMKDEDESPGGRRKRRSSISHFRSSSTVDTKSFYSSSSSGFRTPPAAYAHTPTKNYKDLRSYSDHKQVVSLPKYNNNNTKPTTANPQNADYSWLNDVVKINNNNKMSSSNTKELSKFNVDDDDADSDSSSDLFELQNYDLGIYSSGLPVYETTHMDSIKRGAPISSAAL